MIEEVNITIGAKNQGGYSGKSHEHQITREITGKIPILPINLVNGKSVKMGNVTNYYLFLSKFIMNKTAAKLRNYPHLKIIESIDGRIFQLL